MKNRTLTSEVAVTQRLVILNKANTPKAEGRGIFLEGRESPTMRTRSLLVIYFMHSGILADDHYGIVESHDGSRCYVDKDNPRTEITITKVEAEESQQVRLF